MNILDKGFIELVGHFGDDSTIVKSARVSYSKGTKTLREDKELLRHLLRWKHLSPFEIVNFTFHIKAPLFVVQQVLRHRTARLNQQSHRYSEITEEFYIPEKFRSQSDTNKQGSEVVGEWEDDLLQATTIAASCENSVSIYKTLLANGTARELARSVLPHNTYTELIWQSDARNLMNFMSLRSDAHAQWEIQEYARAMIELVRPMIPETIRAWEDYNQNSETLSAAAIEILKATVRNSRFEPNNLDLAINVYCEDNSLSKGERREIKEQITRILS